VDQIKGRWVKLSDQRSGPSARCIVKAIEAVPIQGGIAGIFTMANFLYLFPLFGKEGIGEII